MLKLLFIVLLLFLFDGAAFIHASHKDCNKRRFPGILSNSFVCVCNATSCDSIDSVDMDDIDIFYQEFITTRDDEYRLDKFKRKFSNHRSANSMLNITIETSPKYQKIFGFGGAITDSAGFNIFSLSPGAMQQLVNAYFDEARGIEYNVLRVPLAGVDFSLREYSYDDVDGDFNLTHFELSSEDIKWKIPFIKSAMSTSTKRLKLFASAWTAPPWMKTNHDYKGNGTLIGEAGGVYYQAWANYYLRFFQAYKEQGISFWAMTAQNEPTDGALFKFSFNCMEFTPETQAAFIVKNLGPTLKKNGFDDINIMILDDQRLFLAGWPQRLFAYSPDVAKYVSGIAVHWYLDSFVPPSILDKTAEQFPDKWIFGTEACAGSGPFAQHVILGGFDRAENYARFIIQDLNHFVTGWTDWNMALDLKGGPNWANNFVDSPIIVNSTADEFYKQPMYYAMGHFSKYITENSRRVATSWNGEDFGGKASFVVLNDEANHKMIMVFLNEADDDLPISIYDSFSKKHINSVMTAHTIKTIVWFY